MKAVAIIGGSGLYALESVKILKEHKVETPFGKPSGKIVEAEISGRQIYFLPRHGEGHTISPTEINYRANIFALKSLGVDTIISISAVGSLKEEYEPTSFVLPDQFIDWTKGFRKRSFFDDGVVGHVSCANPINVELQERVSEVLKKTNIKFFQGGVYLCIEGPQFSTRAESKLYRSFGADVIGMTNLPEAFLAKEAGIAYSTVAMITDYDCWKEEACTVEQIMKVLNENHKSAQILIETLVPYLYEHPINIEKGNANSVITNPNKITKEKQNILSVLLS